MQTQHFVKHIRVLDATAKLWIGLLCFQAPLRYRGFIQVDNLQAAFAHFLNGLIASLTHLFTECLAHLPDRFEQGGSVAAGMRSQAGTLMTVAAFNGANFRLVMYFASW